MVERAPDITEQLLGHIPRLEVVRSILARYQEPRKEKEDAEPSEEEKLVRRGAQLLKGAVELDALEAQGVTVAQAGNTLKGRANQYDPQVLAALLELCGQRPAGETIREVSLAALKPGMIFATDVKMTTGTLFVARGYEITESFLERVRNFRPGSVKEPLKVIVRDED